MFPDIFTFHLCRTLFPSETFITIQTESCFTVNTVICEKIDEQNLLLCSGQIFSFLRTLLLTLPTVAIIRPFL